MAISLPRNGTSPHIRIFGFFKDEMCVYAADPTDETHEAEGMRLNVYKFETKLSVLRELAEVILQLREAPETYSRYKFEFDGDDCGAEIIGAKKANARTRRALSESIKRLQHRLTKDEEENVNMIPILLD